jgi:hypothetical protein
MQEPDGMLALERLERAVEKVRDRLLRSTAALEAAGVPDVDEAVSFRAFRVLGLEALVRMKLTSYRLKDRVHLLDMIGIGLVDASWPARFPQELAGRLQQLLDTPDG